MFLNSALKTYAYINSKCLNTAVSPLCIKLPEVRGANGYLKERIKTDGDKHITS